MKREREAAPRLVILHTDKGAAPVGGWRSGGVSILKQLLEHHSSPQSPGLAPKHDAKHQSCCVSFAYRLCSSPSSTEELTQRVTAPGLQLPASHPQGSSSRALKEQGQRPNLLVPLSWSAMLLVPKALRDPPVPRRAGSELRGLFHKGGVVK